MPHSVTAFVALGSNLGDRRANLFGAIDALRRLGGTTLGQVSPFIESKAVTFNTGDPQQPDYLNAAAKLSTTLAPRDLLGALLDIERSAGRDRSREQRWGPRPLDLDLLLYADAVITEPGLTVPHPSMHERLFVLEPLAAIAPGARHPALGMSITELLAALRARGG